MEVIHELRRLLHIDKPAIPISTEWRPGGWDSSVEIDGLLVDIKDIFFKFKFVEPVDLNDEWFFLYWMKDFDKLETLSKRFYGGPHKWWTIPLVNNKLNPIFSFPLRMDEIENLAHVMLKEKSPQADEYKLKSWIISIMGERIARDLFEQYNIATFEAVFSIEEWKQIKIDYPTSYPFIEPFYFFDNTNYFLETEKVNTVVADIDVVLYEYIIDRANEKNRPISMRELDRDYDKYLFDFYELFWAILHELLIENNEKKRSIILVKPHFMGDFMTMLRKQISQDIKTDGHFNYLKDE